MTPTELIYALLNEEKWTLAKLSRALGYESSGTMSNRLRRGNPTVSTLTSIADAMGYEVVVRSKTKPDTEFVVK